MPSLSPHSSELNLSSIIDESLTSHRNSSLRIRGRRHARPREIIDKHSLVYAPVFLARVRHRHHFRFRQREILLAVVQMLVDEFDRILNEESSKMIVPQSNLDKKITPIDEMVGSMENSNRTRSYWSTGWCDENDLRDANLFKNFY